MGLSHRLALEWVASMDSQFGHRPRHAPHRRRKPKPRPHDAAESRPADAPSVGQAARPAEGESRIAANEPQAHDGRTDWSAVAEWYDQLVGEDGSEYHRHVVHPGIMRLLNPSRDDAILDVACGQGVFCRLLSQMGVGDVVGVDASAELIRAANRREVERRAAASAEPAASDGMAGDSAPRDAAAGEAKAGDTMAGGVRTSSRLAFVVGDATGLAFLPARRFTAATCILAIQNLDPIEPVFTGIARALRPGGRLVIVMMHPCFRAPKFMKWHWDENGVQWRMARQYLTQRCEQIVAHPGSDPDTHTLTFHRPIGAYVAALSAAGMAVDAMEEWPGHRISEPGPRAEAENLARREIPMFLAIRATCYNRS